MNMMYELEQLFKEWEKCNLNNGYSHFITDGIVNDCVWSQQKVKICFFLKEAYLSDNDKNNGLKWNIVKDTLNNGIIKRMWHSVSEWTYGILNTTETTMPVYRKLTYEEKCDALRKIAVVNVKKSDGKSNSTWDNLVDVVNCNKGFIKQEIEIIAPNILICGNNASLLRLIYEDKLTELEELRRKHYCWIDNLLIIDFYHPANQFPKFMNYYTLCAIYQQALKEQKA